MLLNYLLILLVLLVNLLPVFRVYHDVDVHLFLLFCLLGTLLSTHGIEHTLDLILDRLSVKILFLDGDSPERSGLRAVPVVDLGRIKLLKRIVSSYDLLHTRVAII